MQSGKGGKEVDIWIETKIEAGFQGTTEKKRKEDNEE
jgi:hypothetical protein